MLKRIVTRIRHELRPRGGYDELKTFLNGGLTAEEEASLRASSLGRIFVENEGRLIHKWVHFLPIYERYFAAYADKAPHFLEIGVSGGGSLEMWRKYFGADATIFGMDIDPACAERVDAPNQVRIGSQADPVFLEAVAAEAGPFDIILDDGSHAAAHQRASLEVLWKHVKVGGLYMIEDAHTSYWSGWGGGLRRKGSAIEVAKDIVDDLHGWYHKGGTRFIPKEEIAAVHFHDSIIVLEKARVTRPKTVQIPADKAL
jgi:hypothetical protein